MIQIPRLDGFKSIIFSQRLLVFNETFAPAGAYTRSMPVSACIWPESITGRSSNEIMSCFFKVIKKYAYLKSLIFWLDNCTAQNKNWNLFQHVLLLINDDGINLEQITFKYFESGHTFMAADSFHGAVENKMCHGRVITFTDFRTTVSSATKNVDVIEMDVDDFFQAKLNVSQYTLNRSNPRPYIDNMRKVIFEKGRCEIGYSSNISGEELHYCQLLSKKQLKLVETGAFNLSANVSWQTSPRGIEPERKASLLGVVLPLIDEEEKAFFNDLPIKEKSVEEH